jgi:hypothetical protein
MLCTLTDDELAAAVEQTAEELLWEAGIDAVPVDAGKLARSLGLTVAPAPAGSPRGQLVRMAGQRGAILAGADTRPERQQFAIAHEVGEFVAARVFGRLGLDPRETFPASREATAHRLATALLLPLRWFRRASNNCEGDVAELKRQFRTASHELIARRILETSRTPVVMSVFDHGRLVWRRSNLAPSQSAPLVPLEERLQQETHRLGIPREAADLCPPFIDRIRVWPVHEANWKREIMRTDLAETCDESGADF